ANKCRPIMRSRLVAHGNPYRERNPTSHYPPERAAGDDEKPRDHRDLPLAVGAFYGDAALHRFWVAPAGRRGDRQRPGHGPDARFADGCLSRLRGTGADSAIPGFYSAAIPDPVPDSAHHGRDEHRHL